jgi:hypothetical protein
VFDLGLFVPFLRRFSQLEKLELETTDVLTTQNHQLEELAALIGLIHALPFASFSVKGTSSSKIRAIVLDYLRLFYQPDRSWTPTTLTIGHTKFSEDFTGGCLKYTVTKAKHRELSMLFPKIGTDIQNFRDAYIDRFAPYVDTVTIDFQYTNINDKACELFLHSVLTQCTLLNTLIVSSGACFEAMPPTANNTTLENLLFDGCQMSVKFIQSLSTACLNLRQLTLVDIGWDDYIKRIDLPQLELQQLNLVVVAELRMMQQGVVLKIITNKATKYYHIDFDRYTVTLKQKREEKKWLLLTFKFKKLERLRIEKIYGNISVDLD